MTKELSLTEIYEYMEVFRKRYPEGKFKHHIDVLEGPTIVFHVWIKRDKLCKSVALNEFDRRNLTRAKWLSLMLKRLA